MDMNKLLHVSTYAGRIMLESGAETYRVEETICRICYSFGVDEADSFVTPTGIMVSICHDNKTYSLINRVKSRSVDLNKIDKINELPRTLQSEPMDLSHILKLLKEIDNGERYSFPLTLAFSALAAGTFSILFGGGFNDLLAATFIGFIIKIVTIKFQRLSINEFFINCIGGATAASLTLLLVILGFNINIDKTIIGAIMLLVPGLAITNAIRDTIAGDFLAGLTKAAEAFLIAISIAVGSGAILSFWINTLGGSI